MSSLEIFVLAMIAKAGTRTLYDFKAVGISTGAVAGPIASLLEKKYLLKSASTGRSQIQTQELAITRDGTKALLDNWRKCLVEIPSDMGAALRAFWVACLMGDSEEGSSYLRRVAWTWRSELPKEGIPLSEEGGRYLRSATIGHRWLRRYQMLIMTTHEARELEAVASLADGESVIAGIPKGDKANKKAERNTQTSKSKKEER